MKIVTVLTGKYLLFAFIFGLLNFSCNWTAQEAGIYHFIEAGKANQVIIRGTPWTQEKGGLTNTGIYNELYTGMYIPNTDFHLRAKLSLSRIDSTTALFMLFDNHIGFDCKGDVAENTQSRFFFYSKVHGTLERYEKTDLHITPGEPFLWEVIRKADTFSIKVNDQLIMQLLAEQLVPPLAGLLGFRPWLNEMHIYDLSIEGPLEVLPKLDYLWEKGQQGYSCFRLPAIQETNNNILVAVAEGRKELCYTDNGDIDVVIKRSSDYGATWEPLQVAWDEGPHSAGNPVLLKDTPTNRLILLGSRHLAEDSSEKVRSGKSKDTRRVFALYSEDDGKRWSPPKEITHQVKKEDWTWYGTGPGSGIQIRAGKHKGRLVVACYHVRQGEMNYRSHIIYSDDGGFNWQIGGQVPDAGVNEGEIVELKNGDLMLNMRNAPIMPLGRQVAISKDGGMTFSPSSIDTNLVEPSCHGSLHYWPEKEFLLFSNPSHRYTRINMEVKLSSTEGSHWNRSLVLHKGPAAYSDLIVLENGQIGCLYEAGHATPYEGIIFQRMQEEDLK